MALTRDLHCMPIAEGTESQTDKLLVASGIDAIERSSANALTNDVAAARGKKILDTIYGDPHAHIQPNIKRYDTDRFQSFALRRKVRRATVISWKRPLIETAFWWVVLIAIPFSVQLVRNAYGGHACLLCETFRSHQFVKLSAASVSGSAFYTAVALGTVVHLVSFFRHWRRYGIGSEGLKHTDDHWAMMMEQIPRTDGPWRPMLVPGPCNACISLFLALTITALLSGICWVPPMLYLNHVTRGFSLCHDSTCGSKNKTLRREVECFIAWSELGNRTAACERQNILSKSVAPQPWQKTDWIQYLEGKNAFTAFEFAVSQVQQVNMMEIYGSILFMAAVIVSANVSRAWRQAWRDNSILSRDFMEEVIAHHEFVPLRFLDALDGFFEEGLPNLGNCLNHANDSGQQMKLKEYLEDLNKLEIWKSIKPNFIEVEHSWPNFSSALWGFAFALGHFLLPLLYRVSPIEGRAPFLPHNWIQMLSQLINHGLFTFMLWRWAYAAQRATFRYKHQLTRLRLFKSMWHLPTLELVVGSFPHENMPIVTVEDGGLFLGNIGKEQELFEQFHYFVDTYRFFHLSKPCEQGSQDVKATISNITAWWNFREYLAIDVSQARFEMEGSLMLSVFYGLIGIVWFIVKLAQRDYSHLSSMNFIALWDVAFISYIALNGLQICIALNQHFYDDRIGLSEVRKDIFVDGFSVSETAHATTRTNSKKLARLHTTKPSFRRSIIDNQPDVGPAVPGEQWSKMLVADYLDAIYHRLSEEESPQKVFGFAVDKAMEVRLLGALTVTASTLFLKIVTTIWLDTGD